VYLDTAILVTLLAGEPDSDFYVARVDGQPVWSSHLIVIECFRHSSAKNESAPSRQLIAGARRGRSILAPVLE